LKSFIFESEQIKHHCLNIFELNLLLPSDCYYNIILINKHTFAGQYAILLHTQGKYSDE